MPTRIPGELNNGHFFQIKGILKTVLEELSPWGARRVTSRLNRSDQNVAAPVWVGVVESDDIVVGRGTRSEPHDIGRNNFRDEHKSTVYAQALAAKGQVIERSWDQDADRNEKDSSPGAKKFGPKANCNYQRFIAIKMGGKCVGTLTVGFDQKPGPALVNQIDGILGRWAQTDNSEYVKYLRDFSVNGPNAN